MLTTIFLVVALVCFILAAANYPPVPIDIGWWERLSWS